MRSILSAALALTLACFAGEATAQSPAAPTPALPKAPVPYTALHPKPRPAAARPAGQGVAQIAGPSGPLVAAAPVSIAAPVSTGAKLAPGQPLPPAELDAFVDGLVRDAMAREHIAGVTIAVVQNGQVVLKKGYGFASLKPQRPVDPDRSLFRVGSISKTFTWIALMKEVEAGRIRLNQPVNLYLPEKVQVRDQGYDQPIRVANLLDHSAGFEDRALGQLFERDPNRVRPLELYLRQERPRRVHTPGYVASYSNYGAALAGEAVTYTSGKPFERLIEDEIFMPLGMTHTTFREPRPAREGLPAPMPERLAGDIAQPMHWSANGFEQRAYEYVGQIAPAGSASSTAADMSRYMLALLNGGQLGGVSLYGPTTAQAFRTPLRRTPQGINGWANGFMVYDLTGGYRGYGHAGDTIDFHSNLVVAPALNLGVFISTNSETGQALAQRLPDRIIQAFYAPPRPFPRGGSAELQQDPASVAGYYLTSRRAYGGLEGFVTALAGGTQVSVTPGGLLKTRSHDGSALWSLEGPLAERRFVATNGPERIVFSGEPDQARAYYVASGAALMERMPFWRAPSTLAWLAGLTAFCALATLAGVAVRNRREFRENQVQGRASLVQNMQAVLWLTSIALFGLFAMKAGDLAQVMYRWPGALMITASACALVASALTLVTVVALPAIWRGGRRVDSWNQLRKAGFTLTVLIYGAFATVLGLWGALSPWG